MLNAAAPTEMARWAGTVDEVYAVPLNTGADTMAEGLQQIPQRWDYVLDNMRRSQPLHAAAVPGLSDWWPLADGHFTASKTARQQIANWLCDECELTVALLPAGSSERAAYPSARSWSGLVGAIRDRWPTARIILIGSHRDDGRTTTQISPKEHHRLARQPGMIDAFDRPLDQQLALVETADVFLSTHSGFGMAALAVSTPWVTISGGRWPEYFFNDVAFRSVLPSGAYGAFSLYDPPAVIVNDEGDGPRQPHVSRARLREDRSRIIEAIAELAANDLAYETALTDYYQQLHDLLGSDVSKLFSIDMVHRKYLAWLSGLAP